MQLSAVLLLTRLLVLSAAVTGDDVNQTHVIDSVTHSQSDSVTVIQ
jgi:hypothetical protein